MDIGYVWMMPRSGSFSELMNNLDQWPQTLAAIDTIGFAAHRLTQDYTNEEREAGFAKLQELGVSLALEVGAIKEFTLTGVNTFFAQTIMWQDLLEQGANIGGIVLDEPLVNVFNFPQHDHVGDAAAKFEYAVEETAEFIKLVREHYPDWFIAGIEAFPFFNADFIIRWIDALEARLAAKGIRGQDFFRLDVDWNALGVTYTNGLKERVNISWEQGWREVKRIEDHCRSIGLRFSLVYWAAKVPASQALMDDPSSWFNGIMEMGQGYHDAGGRPDQYVIQTWIPGIPIKTLPETDPESFTYSVAEFYKRFIPEKKEVLDE